jgi:hypothetical protein
MVLPNIVLNIDNEIRLVGCMLGITIMISKALAESTIHPLQKAGLILGSYAFVGLIFMF